MSWWNSPGFLRFLLSFFVHEKSVSSFDREPLDFPNQGSCLVDLPVSRLHLESVDLSRRMRQKPEGSNYEDVGEGGRRRSNTTRETSRRLAIPLGRQSARSLVGTVTLWRFHKGFHTCQRGLRVHFSTGLEDLWVPEKRKNLSATCKRKGRGWTGTLDK